MFWFEYNFLFVLAAGGSAPRKSAWATTPPPATPARALLRDLRRRARLRYAQGVAKYILFLAETTGPHGARAVMPPACCSRRAAQRLDGYGGYGEQERERRRLADIEPAVVAS